MSRRLQWVMYALIAILVILMFVIASYAGKKEEALQARLSPLQYAQHEVADGYDEGAIRDLKNIRESSPEYAEAQIELGAAEQRIALKRPPHTKRAEAACKQAMRSKEEFPSTIDVNLFDGVSTSVDKNAREISVTIKYTAKNGSGAELPYQVDCVTNFTGMLLSADRHGR